MESENIKEQIRATFQNLGMNPEKIRYNRNLNYFLVDIGVDGTEEKYLRDIGEIGSSGPVDSAVDANKLKQAVDRINGTEISDGVINITAVMKDSHFKLKVE